MARWNLSFVLDAENDLSALNHKVRTRVLDKAQWLQDNFDAITPVPLSNIWRGFFKLRVGDLRIIYKLEWDKNKIIVVAVGHRSDIYKI